MAQAFLLTEADRRLLADFLAEARRKVRTTTGRAAPEEPDILPPEVYVALTPSGGIPRLRESEVDTGTAYGSGDIPGSAVCDIYRLLDDGGTKRLSRAGFTRRVYNLSSGDLPGGQWTKAVRDKFGQWYADTAGGSGNVVVEETDPRCESGVLNVYKRNVSLVFAGGAISKVNGSWLLSHRAGCCECTDTGTGTGCCTSVRDVLNYRYVCVKITSPSGNVTTGLLTLALSPNHDYPAESTWFGTINCPSSDSSSTLVLGFFFDNLSGDTQCAAPFYLDGFVDVSLFSLDEECVTPPRATPTADQSATAGTLACFGEEDFTGTGGLPLTVELIWTNDPASCDDEFDNCCRTDTDILPYPALCFTIPDGGFPGWSPDNLLGGTWIFYQEEEGVWSRSWSMGEGPDNSVRYEAQLSADADGCPAINIYAVAGIVAGGGSESAGPFTISCDDPPSFSGDGFRGFFTFDPTDCSEGTGGCIDGAFTSSGCCPSLCAPRNICLGIVSDSTDLDGLSVNMSLGGTPLEYQGFTTIGSSTIEFKLFCGASDPAGKFELYYNITGAGSATGSSVSDSTSCTPFQVKGSFTLSSTAPVGAGATVCWSATECDSPSPYNCLPGTSTGTGSGGGGDTVSFTECCNGFSIPTTLYLSLSGSGWDGVGPSSVALSYSALGGGGGSAWQSPDITFHGSAVRFIFGCTGGSPMTPNSGSWQFYMTCGGVDVATSVVNPLSGVTCDPFSVSAFSMPVGMDNACLNGWVTSLSCSIIE